MACCVKIQTRTHESFCELNSELERTNTTIYIIHAHRRYLTCLRWWTCAENLLCHCWCVVCHAGLLRCVAPRWVLQCALAYPYSLLITPLWKTENHTVDASSIWDWSCARVAGNSKNHLEVSYSVLLPCVSWRGGGKGFQENGRLMPALGAVSYSESEERMTGL